MWHVAFTGEMRNAYRILLRELELKNNLVNLDVDGRKILRCIL
jgi:hypothetical protein